MNQTIASMLAEKEKLDKIEKEYHDELERLNDGNVTERFEVWATKFAKKYAKKLINGDILLAYKEDSHPFAPQEYKFNLENEYIGKWIYIEDEGVIAYVYYKNIFFRRAKHHGAYIETFPHFAIRKPFTGCVDKSLFLTKLWWANSFARY